MISELKSAIPLQKVKISSSDSRSAVSDEEILIRRNPKLNSERKRRETNDASRKPVSVRETSVSEMKSSNSAVEKVLWKRKLESSKIERY